MDSAHEPLLDPAATDRLRMAFEAYTCDAVDAALGLIGRAALGRGDFSGVSRALRASDDVRTVTLIRLFVLGAEVTEEGARTALAPLPLDVAVTAGLIEVSAGAARALLDIRPYAENASVLPGSGSTDHAWWVVSDFGSDARPGPLAANHVLGIGAAALTLAQATQRRPVARALDIGTGCGVQALHLGRHAATVCATDISGRALRYAATTAALSGQSWELRQGSLLEPVVGEQYDLVVANPPFVVSGGSTGDNGFDYRDSGLAGDDVCRRLVMELPALLAPGGTAQLLANWIIPAVGDWRDRVLGWLAGSDCDAWVWQREVAEPAEYVALWLRDAGEQPGTPRWAARYERWLDWFATNDVAAIGMGMVTLWQTGSQHPVRVLEDVPQPLEQPIWPALPDWIDRGRWLASTDDDALLDTRLRAADGVVHERRDLIGESGWSTAYAALRQSHGMRWEVEVDAAVAALVAACDGTRALRLPISLLAASVGAEPGEVATALTPVVRDLVERGFLCPPAADEQRWGAR